jgi:hypothetical protein
MQRAIAVFALLVALLSAAPAMAAGSTVDPDGRPRPTPHAQ